MRGRGESEKINRKQGYSKIKISITRRLSLPKGWNNLLSCFLSSYLQSLLNFIGFEKKGINAYQKLSHNSLSQEIQMLGTGGKWAG